ncbi:MAG: sulfur carrier protein ThiS [Pseudobacteriovorax sp.]|nr:sulfur carrier protein ThiS [Pseudobacteriovorax sp.]
MEIQINGKLSTIPENLTISELIKHLGYRQGSIAVAQNQSCVLRRDYEHTRIAQGDDIEILAPMSGG